MNDNVQKIILVHVLLHQCKQTNVNALSFYGKPYVVVRERVTEIKRTPTQNGRAVEVVEENLVGFFDLSYLAVVPSDMLIERCGATCVLCINTLKHTRTLTHIW